jgi:TonB family protein
MGTIEGVEDCEAMTSITQSEKWLSGAILMIAALALLSCVKPLADNTTFDLLGQYQTEVAIHIQDNWKPPPELLGDEDQFVSYRMKVYPDGSIRDITLFDSTGNHRLEGSALRAIEASNPLPPHPPDLDEPYVDIGINFHPRRL